MSDAIEKALLTWYPKDYPLHFDPKHPAIKLAGEAGEILDLYGKNEYKPGFNWWNCKHCKRIGIYHNIRAECNPTYSQYTTYTPLILDELGDLWYYLRILTYIAKQENLLKETFVWKYENVLVALSGINYSAAKLLDNLLRTNEVDTNQLYTVQRGLISVCELLNVTIDELTESNYIKLNSDQTHHGWEGA